MIRVFITARLIPSDSAGQIYDAYDRDWGAFFGFQRDIEWNWLPTGANFENNIQWTDKDLVVFSGGNNLVEVEANEINQTRENFERELYLFLRKQYIPVLGVCKGAQLIQHLEGGRPLKPVEGHAGTTHSLTWTSPHPLDRLQKVVSHHDFALSGQEIPETVEILATDMDGHPEVIHVKDHPILGLMWHPERQSEPVQKFFLEYLWSWMHER